MVRDLSKEFLYGWGCLSKDFLYGWACLSKDFLWPFEGIFVWLGAFRLCVVETSATGLHGSFSLVDLLMK